MKKSIIERAINEIESHAYSYASGCLSELSLLENISDSIFTMIDDIQYADIEKRLNEQKTLRVYKMVVFESNNPNATTHEYKYYFPACYSIGEVCELLHIDELSESGYHGIVIKFGKKGKKQKGSISF